MINLNKKIERNKFYINSWNIFSKLLLIKNELLESSSFLIVVENEKTLNNYKKIWEYLGIKINNLTNISDFVNLYYNKSWKYIVSKEFFNLKFDDKNQFEYHNLFIIKKNEIVKISEITEKLNKFWYSFSSHNNKNTFNILWDILSITDSNLQTIKISLWWDIIDSIIIWKKSFEMYSIWKIWNLEYNNNYNKNLEIPNEVFLVLDSLDFYSSYDNIISYIDNYISFNSLSTNKENINLWINDLFLEKIDDFKNILEENNIEKYIFTKNRKTIENFLELNNLSWIKVYETSLNNIKSFRTVNSIIITDDNISRIFVKKRIKRKLSQNLDLLMQIKQWDYIVHIDHWVWIFNEIVEKDVAWIKKEYITLEYRGNDKLFVPITEVSRVSKYVWSENPNLTWLSTKDWEKKLKKASANIEVIAWELLDLYAKRKLQKWFKFESYSEQEQRFANTFEYTYTDDQLNIIKEIYNDMESEHPMDRLLSWDVWFGKTEIAFASIYKAIINNKQAALISPLVVLAYEHYEKAIDRFKPFPINIGVITRFEKAKVVKVTLQKLKEWKIDLVIWTHRLLSEDIEFKDLWVLVVDEEHKFWVKDKERIKKLKWNIDILSMSATPIPRSLNMALNWVKSVSMLTTPPVGRQSVSTMVSAFDDRLIFDAWKKEFDRWWQLFFIHNRVETIEAMWNYLSNIFPAKKIAIVHWQLSWDKLEKRIIEFKRKQHDILLATTVVENWIDFSNVNTIFINEAQNFWISQIHQLRWRVGRSNKKWYCYLLFRKDNIKTDAAKRLKTIVDYSHLWAWFELAVKDLEIRWWWDILGIRQSGHSHDIWVNLFLKMLEDKVEELKNKVDKTKKTKDKEKVNIITNIDLNIEAYIDNWFFASELDKLNFYREIESIDTLIDLKNIIHDFKEINNNIDDATNTFFDILKLKIRASKYKIINIKKIWINYQIDFSEWLKVEELKSFLELDKELKFIVVWVTKLRTSIKSFANEKKFIQYMLQLFEKKLIKKKIRLKRV
jgi:transcription-repair coupling factor (superfamily II helicase)